MLRKRKPSPEKTSNRTVTAAVIDDEKERNLFLERSGARRKASKWKRVALWTTIFIGPLLLIYLAIPVLFRYSPAFRRNIIFMNHVNLQPLHDLNKPEKDYGLNCTRSFFIEEGNLKLGAWHVFPGKRLHECDPPNKRPTADDFDDDSPVILYFHGNGGTRGGSHRTELYKVLAYSGVNAHVITIDYRSYADSSSADLSANGLTSDAEAAYFWLSSKVNTTRLNVWGHSLGTAVSIRLVSKLSGPSSPNTLILEAPFTNVGEAAASYPLAIAYSWWPCFKWFFIEPLSNTPATNFDSMSLIREIYSPMLILHAKDDKIVPYELGQKLYKEALLSTKAIQKSKMITFNEHLNYGHKNIYRDKELPRIIADFIRVK